MRFLILTAAMSALAILAGGSAEADSSKSNRPVRERTAPTWNECYELGVVWRGVHVELGELDHWMEQCLSGKIPFHTEIERPRKIR